MGEMKIEEAARLLGIELLPWQVDVGQRILDDEHFYYVSGRRWGRAVLARVVDHARNGEEA